MFEILCFIVCGLLALWVLQKQSSHRRVKFNGNILQLNGSWYVFPFYQLAFLTIFAESSLVITITLLLLFLFKGLQNIPIKSFMHGYNVWYTLLIAWYFFNLIRSDNIIYGANQVFKLLFPIIIFTFAYHSYKNKNNILYLFEFLSKSTLLFWCVCTISRLSGVDITYHYFGMEVVVYPFLLFLMTTKRKYAFYILLCFSFCLVYIKRTCLIGILCMLVVYLLYKYRYKALLPLIGVVIISFGAIFYIPALTQRIFHDGIDLSYVDWSIFLTGDVFEYVNTNGRSNVWVIIIDKLFSGNEIIGIGPGSLKAWISSPILNENFDSFQRVHNDWLQIMVEGGYIALTLIIVCFVKLFIKTYKVYRNKSYTEFTRNIALGTAMVTSATIVHMFFENCMGCVGFCIPWLFSAILFRALGNEKYERAMIVK